MRNLIQIINREYGKEALTVFRKWENLNVKICNYKNDRRFSLRCLGNGIILVSIKLKNNIRTYRSDCIIQKAERGLLNERIRNVNNILDWLEHDTYMYELKLSAILNQDLMEECKEFIVEYKGARHMQVMECQKKKYEMLWWQKYHSSKIGTAGHSNQGQDQVSTASKNKPSVVNLSSEPPSTAQETVLAHGPNFAVTSKIPPYQEYITVVEVAYQRLKPTEAEEFRADIARVLKQARPPKANISKEFLCRFIILLYT